MGTPPGRQQLEGQQRPGNLYGGNQQRERTPALSVAPYSRGEGYSQSIAIFSSRGLSVLVGRRVACAAPPWRGGAWPPLLFVQIVSHHVEPASGGQIVRPWT